MSGVFASFLDFIFSLFRNPAPLHKDLVYNAVQSRPFIQKETRSCTETIVYGNNSIRKESVSGKGQYLPSIPSRR